jgi:hypothetical protein
MDHCSDYGKNIPGLYNFISLKDPVPLASFLSVVCIVLRYCLKHLRLRDFLKYFTIPGAIESVKTFPRHNSRNGTVNESATIVKGRFFKDDKMTHLCK